MFKKQNGLFVLMVVFWLAGCATPPEPANCKGSFKPVNADQHASIKQTKLAVPSAIAQSDMVALDNTRVVYEQN